MVGKREGRSGKPGKHLRFCSEPLRTMEVSELEAECRRDSSPSSGRHFQAPGRVSSLAYVAAFEHMSKPGVNKRPEVHPPTQIKTRSL